MPAQERYVGIWGMCNHAILHVMMSLEAYSILNKLGMNEVIVKDKEFTECGKCPQCDEQIKKS